MVRRIVPFALLAAVLIGCAAKKDEPAGSEGGGGEPAPTGPAYTIALRPEKAGDRSVVAQSGTSVITSEATGSKGKQPNAKKEQVKYEYTETIREMPVGARLPTKLTRTYKVAEIGVPGGPTKALSYVGKTVAIEKKGAVYTVTANGKRLPAAEELAIRNNFESPALLQAEDFLPKKPVQLNEKWSLDPDVVVKAGAVLNMPVSREKSTGTGRLTRVFMRDGTQWGTIEIAFAFVIDQTASGETLSGNPTFTIGYDLPIDGSSREWTKTVKVNGTVKRAGQEMSVETTLEIDGVETRTPVK